jgi:hypothetical protein
MAIERDLRCMSNALMAREETTAEQIAELGKQVVGIGATINEIAEQIRKLGAPSVRLHLGTLTNVVIPQLQHWLDVARTNANEDLRSFQRGIESKSLMQKRYNEKRALSAAKKSEIVTKKSVKTSSKKAKE